MNLKLTLSIEQTLIKKAKSYDETAIIINY